jgi:hypothetical protein
MATLHISTDKTALDVPLIHQFLSEHSTWAIGIPLAVVERAIDNSLCFGAYLEGKQVAFARVTTDCATLPIWPMCLWWSAGAGRVCKVLLETVLEHPDLQGLRRFMLATSDAHDLYARYGFTRRPARPP